MGVQNLWPTLKPICEPMQPLLDYAIKEGFQEKYHYGRKLNLGVDASLYLAGIQAAHLKRSNIHSSSNPFHTLYHQLSRYIRAPVNLVYVFDGPHRPALKRNKHVVDQSIPFHEKAKKLIRAFGFHVYDTTYADAEAELVTLAHNGTFDGIITEDSDAVVFGAPRIFRINSGTTSTKVFVDVYSAEKIENDLSLTRTGLILFALLVGGDCHDGVQGCGPITAHAMVKCGFGEALVNGLDEFGGSDQELMTFLVRWKHEMADEMIHNHQGYLRHRNKPAADEIIRDATFPSLGVIAAYRQPETNQSMGLPLPDTSQWRPSEPNPAAIAQLCISELGWTSTYLLRRFDETLWHGIALQMLYSKYLVYNFEDRKLASPSVNAIIRNPKDTKIHDRGKNEIRTTLSISSFFNHLDSKMMRGNNHLRNKMIVVVVPQSVLSVATAKSKQQFNDIMVAFNAVPRAQALSHEVIVIEDDDSDSEIEFGELEVRENFIDLSNDSVF
ncbi:hypothetical protein VKT23_016950 [Stygiomarasmius scandens]|uniref:XPG-I domain-containing protein n=1 Tax=Marasmiellus scandens TaxID=2682957 RepID=A0ABR1IWE5_9AGAR